MPRAGCQTSGVSLQQDPTTTTTTSRGLRSDERGAGCAANV